MYSDSANHSRHGVLREPLCGCCDMEIIALVQGGGAAGAVAGASSEMDLATILATFPPDVREEVLLTSEEDVINSLPPALLAEAQQLRQRVMQHYRCPPPPPPAFCVQLYCLLCTALLPSVYSFTAPCVQHVCMLQPRCWFYVHIAELVWV